MEIVSKSKRSSGMLTKDDDWLVLAESQKDADGFVHNCGTQIMGQLVYASVHDGPFPLSGSGEVKNITVPYCPKCERKPNQYGTITHGRLLINS